MYFKQSASSSDYDLYHDDALPAPSAKKGPLERRSEFPQTAIKTALFLAEHTVVPQTAIYVSLSLAVNTIVGNLLRKQLLQNRRFHSQHSSELLICSIVVEV